MTVAQTFCHHRRVDGYDHRGDFLRRKEWRVARIPLQYLPTGRGTHNA